MPPRILTTLSPRWGKGIQESGFGFQDTAKVCTVNKSAAFDPGQSAAAHRDDDFERVPIGQHFVRMPAARHDFAVAFDRDAFSR